MGKELMSLKWAYVFSVKTTFLYRRQISTTVITQEACETTNTADTEEQVSVKNGFH